MRWCLSSSRSRIHLPGLTRYFTPCRCYLRKRQSKGHGVHSPFAFNLITNVIHSPCRFYAFDRIRVTALHNGIDPEATAAFNHLSFRLVHYLRPKNILEINAGNGINTLFLLAPSSHIRCTCVEEDGEMAMVAETLLRQTGRKCERISSLPEPKGTGCDAIFLNLEGNRIPDLHSLAALSDADTFWVLYPIKKGKSKQFWDRIVQDEKVRITFDVKETGIVFLKPGFHKANYFV